MTDLKDARKAAQAADPFAGSAGSAALGNVNDLLAQMIGRGAATVPTPSTALAPTGPVVDGGQIVVGKFRISPIGLYISDPVTPEEWREFGAWIGQLSSALNWVIGDWLAYGQRVHGAEFESAAQIVGKAIKTLYNWSYVSGNVDISRRREKLTFSHHAVVAALAQNQQDWYLEQAESSGWSVGKLAAQIAQDGLQESKKRARTGSFKRHLLHIEKTLDDLRIGKTVAPKNLQKARAYVERLNAWTTEVTLWFDQQGVVGDADEE